MFLPLRFLIHPDKFANTKNNLPRVHILLSKPLCEKCPNTDQKKTPYLDTFHAVNMLLSVADHKKGKLQKSYNSFLEKECLKIRELATLIGTLTATFPGKKLGPQYYRGLNKCKTYALKKSIDNSECSVTLSKDALLDLKWWRYNIITPPKSLQYPPISKVIYTDASNVGWGASCVNRGTPASRGKTVAYKCTWTESHTTRFEIFYKRGENSYRGIFRQCNCHRQHQQNRKFLFRHMPPISQSWSENGQKRKAFIQLQLIYLEIRK